MSERQLEIAKVKAESRENSRQIKLAQNGLGLSQAMIISYQKQIIQLDKDHELRLQDLTNRLNKTIENAKTHQNTIDQLIEEKDAIHLRLKAAIHYGEVQCSYCKFYFKDEEALTRHQKSCIARPDRKVVAEHQEVIKKEKDDLIARKKALEEELAKLKIAQQEEKPIGLAGVQLDDDSAYINVTTLPPQAAPEIIIEEKREIAEELRRVADDMNGETDEIAYLIENCQEWIDQYHLEEGGNAIWQGRITKGFRDWCEAKGYELQL